jgi:MFS family permease
LPEITDAARPVKRGAFAALRHRDFALFWTAGLLSNSGSWMQTITVPFVLDKLTHSTVVVGLGAFLTFFPVVLMGPIGGSFADRYSRRSVLIWSQAVMMLAAFALWALWTSGEATPANLLVCVVVAGCATGITLSSWQAFVTQLVPHEDMLNAVRLNSMQFMGGRTVGPGLAGLVLATLGPGAAFLANGLSFVIVLVALALIPARPAAAVVTEKVWSHFLTGVRYVRDRRVLATAMLTIMVLSFFGQSVLQLAEPFTRRVLHVGGGEYGLLVGVYGGGAILGSLITVYREHLRRSQLVMAGGGVLVASQVAFGLAPGFGFALAVVVVLGIAQVMANISLQTTVQANVDDAHRGRVISIYLASAVGGIPLGALLGGIVSDIVGLRATFVAASIAIAVYMVVLSVRFDRLRLFDGAISRAEAIA